MRRRDTPRPDPFITNLPARPAQLKLKHPDLFAMVFVRDMPVTMKVPLSQVMTVNASYRCRTDSDSGFDSCLKAMCGPGNLQGQFQGNVQLQMQIHQQMAETQLRLQNRLLAFCSWPRAGSWSL